MRKIIVIGTALLMVLLGFLVLTPSAAACDPPSPTPTPEPEPFVSDLIAGGGNPKSAMDVGDVSVWNDDETLYIEYETTGDWIILEIHLAVEESLDDIPQTKNNNPIPGKFEYKLEFDPGVIDHTFEIDLEENGFEADDDLYIAAHAVVYNTVTEQEETAWGDTEGIRFNEKNWAMYFIYTVQGLDITGTYVWRFYYFNNKIYDHDMVITTVNEDGSFSGYGGYPAGNTYSVTWTITGTFSGSAISFYIDYDSSTYYVDGTGTIAGDGSMSGTCYTPQGGPFNWETISGPL